MLPSDSLAHYFFPDRRGSSVIVGAESSVDLKNQLCLAGKRGFGIVCVPRRWWLTSGSKRRLLKKGDLTNKINSNEYGQKRINLHTDKRISS